MTRPAIRADRDTLSFILFTVALIIFIIGAAGGSPFGFKPIEWQSLGLAFFVAAALV